MPSGDSQTCPISDTDFRNCGACGPTVSPGGMPRRCHLGMGVQLAAHWLFAGHRLFKSFFLYSNWVCTAMLHNQGRLCAWTICCKTWAICGLLAGYRTSCEPQLESYPSGAAGGGMGVERDVPRFTKRLQTSTSSWFDMRQPGFALFHEWLVLVRAQKNFQGGAPTTSDAHQY